MNKNAEFGGIAASLLGVVLVCGLGLVVFVLFFQKDEPAAPLRTPPPAAVKVAPVESVTLTETIRGIGSLRSAAEVAIRPEISGRIKAMHFQEGDRVQKGQVLFEIYDEKLAKRLSAADAALETARVRREHAETNFLRLKPLWDRGVISRHEFDQAGTELDSAQAELERLAAEKELTLEQLQDANITAPFDGVISRRLVDRGAFVSVGEHLATVYLKDQIEVVFSIPERHMGRVKTGQDVQIKVDAYPDLPFSGAVVFVSPEVNEATRDFLVKAAVDDPQKALKPGAFASAVLTVRELADRTVIPEEALVATRRGYFVFVVENQIARIRQVEIGLRQVGRVEITRGLNPQEVVIRSGHLQATDGAAVRIINGT